MDEKALYLMAKLDEAASDALGGYYRILREHGFTGQQTQGIPYHFTLGSHKPGLEQQLCADMERVCRQTAAIDIRLGHIGLFGLKVLFIGPNMNLELLNLQKSFFGQCVHGDHPWCAHATLLMDEPDVILRALPIMARHFEPIHARIESVALYEFFPARFIRECPLK